VYLPAETTAKDGFNIGLAGQLAVSFTGGSTEGDSFVAFNSAMTSFRTFGTVETFATKIESPKTIFPFTTEYTVYPGTCEADLPPTSVIEANPSHFNVIVPRGSTGLITTIDPAINLRVLESTKFQSEKPLQNALVKLEDTGCKTVRQAKTNSSGALPRPGMPFGNYSVCVSGTVAGIARYYTRTISSTSASGTALQKIYLGEEGSPGVCP